MSYQSAWDKIDTVQQEVNDGANTADRVGDAMKESLNYAKANFDEILPVVFPLTVSILSQGSNGGNYESTNEYYPVTPTFHLSITRKGADVSGDAIIKLYRKMVNTSSYSEDSGATISGDTITGSSVTVSMIYKITVTQGGQAVVLNGEDTSLENAGLLKVVFMPYVYGFPVDSKPANATALTTAIINAQSTASARTLSTAKTKGSTTLAANKYYVFAVQGNDVTLICRHAETNGIISGCTTYHGDTKLTIPRINGTGSDSYSAIIVEKSASTWNFKITNS